MAYRDKLYKDYALIQENPMVFDSRAADVYKPCLEYYLRGWLPKNRESKILDLGCGDGRNLYILKKMGYEDVSGVDISESQVKIARQVTTQIRHVDMLDFMREAGDEYDFIMAFDVIEHLDKNEVLEVLELIYKLLAKDGRVVMQTPNASSMFHGSVRYGDITHETCFTPNLLRRLLVRAGFKGVVTREAGPVPYGYSFISTVRYMLWKVIRLCCCLMEAIEVGGCADRIYTRVFFISAEKQ